MSEEEKNAWSTLYEYVRKNVMEYDDNQALPSSIVLRLKGLSGNQYMANNNSRKTANYSFDVILNTFKYCLPDIQRSVQRCSFNDERHKFNYIAKIVENNLNTVYMRMKEKQKLNQSGIELVSVAEDNSAGYHTKSTNKNNKRIDDLW